MEKPLTYYEAFVRAYAKQVVERIAVSIDSETGVTTLAFYGRNVEIPMGAIALQEEAFRRIAKAVDHLLGVES